MSSALTSPDPSKPMKQDNTPSQADTPPGPVAAVLASAGLHREDETLCVYRRVRCALSCTGDELVPNTVRPLPKGKIYSSNEAVLASRLADLGAEITTLRGEFHDDPAALAEAIRSLAADADMIITTGGVSVGAKDILHETLPLLNADRIFWQVRLKPGSPLMFSIFEGKPLLSLSGNPFAASATFELFGRVLLAARAGDETLRAQVITAELATEFKKFGRGRRFVRGVFRDGLVSLPQGHSSGQLASAVGTNCLAEIPPADAPIEAGAKVRVWLL
jgi:molybdopterin molybdotransferase